MPSSELILQVRLIGCAFVNTLPEPVLNDDGSIRTDNGRQVNRVVPKEYVFHTPCPFGKSRPDSSCGHCNHHVEFVIGQREVTEPAMDEMVDADPAAWGVATSETGGGSVR